MMRLSNSEIKEYRRCLRKWYLGQYRRLKLRSRTFEAGQPLEIGDWVHDALAAYYDPATRTDPVAFAHSLYEQRLAEAPEWAGDIEKDWKLVKAMLSGYMEWLAETGVDIDLEIEGSETFGEVPLVDDVTLLSKLDAPVTQKSSGAKLALEHKSTKSLTVLLPHAKLDTQYLTEHLVRFLDLVEKGATHEEAYDQCHGILLNMLRKVQRTATAKPPFYGREIVPHNLHELRNHWRHTVAWARMIQATRGRLDAGEEHQVVCPPTPTRDCTWDCPFFKVCVMADDGSDFEGALADLYEEHDPLERYLGAVPL